MAVPIKPPVDGNPANLLLWMDWLRQRSVHRWIHAGYHFKSGTWGSLDGSLNLLFVAGATLEANFFHTIQAAAGIQVKYYRNPTIGAGSLGTVLSVFNSKTASGIVNQGTLYANPGIADFGTRVPFGMLAGGSGAGASAVAGGAGGQREEELLGVNAQCIITILTGAAVEYEYQSYWYEET